MRISDWSSDVCSSDLFTNSEGGIFLAGPVVNLGAGTFTNSGTINPGGAGVVANLNVSGGLAMTSTSVYNVDLDFKTGMADKVIVSGAAALNGTVTTNLLNLGYAQARRHGADRKPGGVGTRERVRVDAVGRRIRKKKKN